MAGVLALLARNTNYRNTWLAQVVSETGDYFNNIAVFSLALANTRSGLVVSVLRNPSPERPRVRDDDPDLHARRSCPRHRS